MTETSDAALLEQFVRHESEAAFAEIANRYIALVHSVALRHTSNPAQAQDITQAVFIILARKAAGLGRKTVLAGWLYHTARLTAANWQRSETRRFRREQEAFMQSTFNESAPDNALWRELSPMLDDAMGRLGKADRDALVLRYFQNRNLAEVGVALGIEERTAQKRVSRALEKLRKIFTKRGVALSATAIAGAVSANAVTAAPVALAEAVAAGALSGTTITTAAVIAATKAIAMTTLQKTIVTIAIAALAGVDIYEARQAHDARAALQKLQQQQAQLAEQIRQLQNDRGNSTNQLADLLAENSHLKSSSNQNELLKLRGQVGLLRAQASQQAKLEREPSIADFAKSSRQMQEILKSSVAASYDKVYGKLFADLKLSPDQVSSLKQLLSDKLTAGMAEKGTMMIRKMSPEQIQQLNDQINTEKAGVDERIKQTLGADGFAAYQAYEKTYNERSQIVGPMGFSDQLTGSMELTSDQTEQLVQAMSDERQQYKFTVDYSDPGKYSGEMATLYSDENISQYQKELEQLHQLYLARAQTILTPDQQTVFQKYLSNRLAVQNMGLNMTAKIVGGKSGGK
ncbi:MAG TPA: sigma-70 family RNA polymerase sigma factor [Verrucomicrobiae bacterium]|jgi:RNA polymerase sigma factor (sigma-70 family)|nr:sigma-70 family RNA polymerase sigma factor [Verrucomicrobiae bacterium]